MKSGPARNANIMSAMPFNPPMGRIEKFDVGTRKLTIQTEFFKGEPAKIETKIYIGGELKKVSSLPVQEDGSEDLQKTLDDFHALRVQEISDGLRRKTAGSA